MTVMEPAPAGGYFPMLPAPVRGSPRVAVHGPRSPYRAEVESFIAAAFAKHFDARVRTFMPMLLALHGDLGEPVAAVGCRDAGRHQLFLEQYTRQPIEGLLRAQIGVTVSREHIIEIGNLACSGPRSALTIVRNLVPFLIHAGYQWCVFTAADTVLGVFRRLHVQPYTLCLADRSLLEGVHDDWGTYYEHAPTVMAGRLLDGLRATARLSRSDQ